MSATSCQRLSIVWAWSRAGISVISVMPGFSLCLQYAPLAGAQGTALSVPPGDDQERAAPRIAAVDLCFRSGLRLAAAGWEGGAHGAGIAYFS